ncbi:M1 family metallopeptidase [Williamwhitmania taraxaci]|uniref:Aminopeptidase N n=1 Tax=Williamwhitmania taraxaci TaxID=1640674 RepID=A0A1G6ND25_9BACT|nr:M1 family aminopeptidase [Williamwhitmania taraxaci]SDC65698.1 aminopeptidase N [Williamwhitmania taraxaci]
MKKIIWAVTLLLASCINKPTEIPEKGVTLSLANERAAILENVEYKLCFTIPDSLTDAVQGEAIITFDLSERPNSLALDFNGPDSSGLKVSSIGEEKFPNVIVGNGHIVIPQRYLTKGVNQLQILFTADSRTLNRSQNFIYTLNVPNKASRVFPCFDQPNIKATYRLEVSLPLAWSAVSNGSEQTDSIADGRHWITFAPSQKISTYLFAFAAGRFNKVVRTVNKMPIAIYYASADSVKIKTNIDEVYNQVKRSLKFMEDYTSIKYPFEKYDLVLIPSFQFSGMEHPGATYYKASKLLLDENPSLQDAMSRTSLIAHETAHMWFGDLVTMSWFNDVWLKEVFAGLFAEKITNPQYPQIDHNLLFMLSNYPRALSVDRTSGTHSIAQELKNQDNAGSLYGSIIYNKAPIAMRMLEENMGEDSFKVALREYLKEYSYSNATWENLLATFQHHSNNDLSEWDKDWIKGKGVPEIAVSIQKAEPESVVVSARSIGIANPQSMAFVLMDNQANQQLEFKSLPGTTTLRADFSTTTILPNSDGKTYGVFTGEALSQNLSAAKLSQISPLQRASLLINQKELAIRKKITTKSYTEFLLTFTQAEKVDALLQQSVRDIEFCFLQLLPATERNKVGIKFEALLWDKMLAQNKPADQITVFKSLMRIATTKHMLAKLEAVLEKNQINAKTKFSDRDGMSLALELAFKMPEQANVAINLQLGRMQSEELKAQLQFERASTSCNNDTLAILFHKLQKKENRMKEPWVTEALSYIHHPLRNEANMNLLIPALNMLPEIKQTGDIFFPKSWADAVLWGYRSPKAKAQVNQLLQMNILSPDLKLKVLQSGDLLMR